MTDAGPAASPPPSPLASPEPWDIVSSAYTDEVRPQFERFAGDALRLANVEAGHRVLDVACGPGTLTVLAARRGARVDAIDFAPGMVAHLRAALEREPLEGVTAQLGDGQHLPFADATYDAGFSMFGLIFFPDRARGLAELFRCLKDGGVAVIGSWQPMEENVPFLAAIFASLRALIPGFAMGSAQAPLSSPDLIHAEMGAAGFREIVVHDVRHTFDFPSTREGWGSMERTMAPLAMLARKMGPAWPALSEKMLGSLVERFGEGVQSVTMPAWLGVGRRAASPIVAFT